MTEVRRESLSALIDGEASEIEVHRLVREFRSDETLARSWTIYQHIRGSIRTGDEMSRLSPEHHLSLFERIGSAIDEEDAHNVDAAGSRSRPATRVVAGSLAVAASLVVAVFLGVQVQQEEAAGGSVASHPAAIPVRPVANNGATSASLSPEVESDLVELDEEKQRRLRAYLNQHDRLSRMNSDKQLVNYQGDN